MKYKIVGAADCINQPDFLQEYVVSLLCRKSILSARLGHPSSISPIVKLHLVATKRQR